MTDATDLRHSEISSAELIAKLRSIAATANELAESVAALAGEPEGVADHVAGADADHHVDDAPSPGNLIAVKPAAHDWRMSEKRLRRIAARYGALHKIGGRWMIDHDKLTAAVFR